MEIEVTVRSGSIPERAKDYAREKISRIHRIFERVGRVHVSLEPGKEEAKAHVVAHLDSGATLVADTIHNELQGAIDLLSDKLERQVRKEKERLISRNRRIQTDLETGSPSEEPEPSYEEVIRKDLEEN